MEGIAIRCQAAGLFLWMAGISFAGVATLPNNEVLSERVVRADLDTIKRGTAELLEKLKQASPGNAVVLLGTKEETMRLHQAIADLRLRLEGLGRPELAQAMEARLAAAERSLGFIRRWADRLLPEDRAGSKGRPPVRVPPERNMPMNKTPEPIASPSSKGLRQAGSISGTIRQTVGLTPVPDALVCAASLGPGGGYGCDNSDENGDYHVASLEPGNYEVIAFSTTHIDEKWDDIACEGSCTEGDPVWVQDGMDTSGIDFVLDRLGAIEGRVTASAGGAPLENVELRLYREEDWRDVTYSASDGQYQFLALPPGNYTVAAFSSECVDELYDGVPYWPYQDPRMGTPVAAQLNATTAGIDFTLDFGGAIEGTVRNSQSGDPVAGASMECRLGGGLVSSAVSDAAGHYRCQGLPGGSFRVGAISETYLDEVYDDWPCETSCPETPGTGVIVAIGSLTSPVDFDLDLGGVIGGTVTDAVTGDPLTDVVVYAFALEGGYSNEGYSDTEGHFSIPDLGLGRYWVQTDNYSNHVDKIHPSLALPYSPWGGWGMPNAGFGAVPVPVAPGAPVQGIDFALDRYAEVSGIVTDAITGQPVADLEVEVGSPECDYEPVWAYTGTDGTYHVQYLLEGDYFAYVSDYVRLNELYQNIHCEDQYALPCDPLAGNGTPIPLTYNASVMGIDFSLEAGGSITGRVTGEGVPLQSVYILAERRDCSQYGYGDTNIQGDYAIPGLMDGDYDVVTLQVPGFVDELFDNIDCWQSNCDYRLGIPVTVTAGSAVTGVDFDLAGGGSISGTVRDALTGLPVNATVYATDFSLDRSNYANTDPAGLFTIPDLPSGQYFVTAACENLAVVVYRDLICPWWDCFLATGDPVSVQTGLDTSGIDFDLPASSAGAIEGTVTIAETGLPLCGAWLKLFKSPSGDELGYNSITDCEGRYRVQDLSPGDYLLMIERGYGPSGPWCAACPSVVSFDLLSEFYDDRHCAWETCVPSLGIPVHVPAGQTTAGIDFQLETGGWISGMVTREPGGEPVCAEISVFDSFGRQAARATSDCMNYRTGAMPTGSYYVVAEPMGDGVGELYQDQACPLASCPLGAGTPVAVTEGAVTPDINFTLSEGGGFSGRVLDAQTGYPVAELVGLELFNASGNSITTNYTYGHPPGSYGFEGLPAGQYFVRAGKDSGYDGILYDSYPCPGLRCDPLGGTPINVTQGLQLTGIDFLMDPLAGRISGVVTDSLQGGPVPTFIRFYHEDGTLAKECLQANLSHRYDCVLSPGTYYAATDLYGSSRSFMGEVYDDLPCAGGTCLPLAGTPIVVPGGGPPAEVDFILDLMPTISIADPSIQEGDLGMTDLVFDVHLSNAFRTDVSVAYVTGGGTATSGEDYQPASGVLVIPASAPGAPLSIPIIGDVEQEQHETLEVVLSVPVNGVLKDASGIGTILNDDGTAVPEVSGNALHPLQMIPGPTGVNLRFENIGSYQYNAYISRHPDTRPFRVAAPSDGKRICAIQGIIPSGDGMLEAGVDLDGGIMGDRTILYVLITADWGNGTEGSLGSDSSTMERMADLYCAR